ncbi:unnamed protein product [Prorocentrum cordatum]|uniref:Uncharacterized protein n=1 Tax=Prorocentrum cordatum TaxID=2364126 RepID=A0ABN9R585_9DINO|nr:unnamed protein product [Polarella glacialis]
MAVDRAAGKLWAKQSADPIIARLSHELGRGHFDSVLGGLVIIFGCEELADRTVALALALWKRAGWAHVVGGAGAAAECCSAFWRPRGAQVATAPRRSSCGAFAEAGGPGWGPAPRRRASPLERGGSGVCLHGLAQDVPGAVAAA